MRRFALLTAAALTASLAACARTPGSGGEALIVVSAPLSSQQWVARFAERGAQLAADQLNAGGGIEYGGSRHKVVVQVLDNGASPQQAASVARTAVARRAVALITDGTGAQAVAAVTGPAQLPVFVVFEGGQGFIDPAKRPTLFRLAPANKPMATRLADYISEKQPKVALITDDSSYGRDGRSSLQAAFIRDELPLAADVPVSASADDLSTAVNKARRSGADTLVVWARAALVAEAIRAARASGWDAAIYSSPSGEDPLVRQRLAEHPDWVDGFTFVSFRVTSETGPEPFAKYRAAYVKKYGEDKLGVGDVLVPPDWSMFSYDATKLLAAALHKAGAPGQALMRALDDTVITGANGDERGYSPSDREGVVPDDMYFGRFKDMRYAPVTDDVLSTSLPLVPQ
ncbi:MAG: branched-chain amino acid transport system substrate-binding protein [Frankiaceae bacterium]|nr:branched-chain amino acid transport system substrate-binding protein [Frankiaceae bacterium]